MCAAPCQRESQPVLKQQAVGQIGERVVQSMVMQLLFGAFALGYVADRTLIIQNLSGGIADNARAFRNPDMAAIPAPDFRLEVGNHAIGFQQAREFRAPRTIHIKLRSNRRERVHHGFGRSIAVDAGQSRVRAQVTPLYSGLKNAFDRVFHNGAIALFGLRGPLFLLLRLFPFAMQARRDQIEGASHLRQFVAAFQNQQSAVAHIAAAHLPGRGFQSGYRPHHGEIKGRIQIGDEQQHSEREKFGARFALRVNGGPLRKQNVQRVRRRVPQVEVCGPGAAAGLNQQGCVAGRKDSGTAAIGQNSGKRFVRRGDLPVQIQQARLENTRRVVAESNIPVMRDGIRALLELPRKDEELRLLRACERQARSVLFAQILRL